MTAHLIILDLVTRQAFDEDYRSGSSSLCSLLQFLVTSSVLVPNISLISLFSNTFKLYSSLSVRDQVLFLYKGKGKGKGEVFPLQTRCGPEGG